MSDQFRIIDSGDALFSSSGLWAPATLDRSTSDPLAGRHHVSASVNPVAYVRRAVLPDLDIVPSLAMDFGQAVILGRRLAEEVSTDAVEIDLGDPA